MATWKNWSGRVEANPRAIVSPESLEELRTIVRESREIRVAGSGHSFTDLCKTSGTLVTLDRMTGIIRHDPATSRATVMAGTSIRDLGPKLNAVGLGLVNQGDIDRQTVSGAVGTGTHGTGITLGSVSSAVTGFQLVAADGKVINCAQDSNPDLFHAGKVSLGSLGIMAEITFQCRPAYVLQEVGGRMPIEETLAKSDELSTENRHFEFFWFPFADEALVKILNESDASPRPSRRPPDGVDSSSDRVFRRICELGRFAPFMRGPLQRFLTRSSGSRYSGALDAPGRVRWSHEAFPSDRNVRFNEMEFAVAAEDGPDCLREVADFMRRSGENFLFPIEYRYVAADEAWLSPFYQRDSATISVHQYWKQSYKRLFEGVEAIFRRYNGRPHWGKLHSFGMRDLEAVYPRFQDFVNLRQRLDPEGKFLNDHLSHLFGGKKAPITSVAAQ